jgi:hypothetical protein
MKPRPVNLSTSGFERSERPPAEGWPDKTNPFEDPEDKTPVAPAPSAQMLANAGAPWYSRHRYALMGGGGAALILIAFVSGLRASSRDAPAVAAPPAPAPLPLMVAPMPATASPPDTMVMSVTVSPPNAQVMLDGQLMPSNPFLTRFPKSTATHRLRAVAPGYQPKERWVSFADNVMLDISLSPNEVTPSRERPARRRDTPPPRKPEVRPAPPPSSASGTAHRAAETPARPEGEKPDRTRRRRIEAADPYAGDQ